MRHLYQPNTGNPGETVVRCRRCLHPVEIDTEGRISLERAGLILSRVAGKCPARRLSISELRETLREAIRNWRAA